LDVRPLGENQRPRTLDPDLITLVASIIAGIANLSTLKRHYDAERLADTHQRNIRKSALRHLRQLWSDLNAWKEIVKEARGFFETSSLSTAEALFQLGSASTDLSEPERKRLQELLGRVHRLQKSTTGSAALLKERLGEIRPVGSSESYQVEAFRESASSAIMSFNQSVFARGRALQREGFLRMEDVLQALEELIRQVSGALKELELVLGSDYDRPL
jgi:uncharacterized protein YciW